MSRLKNKRTLVAAVSIVALTSAAFAAVPAAMAAEAPIGYLYTSTNNVSPGRNAVVGYSIWKNGRLTRLQQGQVATGGTGVQNGFVAGINLGNAKLGPMDNDTPVESTPNGKFIYSINGGSDTIAGFQVLAGGKLKKIPGSPFSSKGINPTSISIDPTSKFLAVANRNEDPLRQAELNSQNSNIATFRIAANGSLKWTGSSVNTAPTTTGSGQVGNQPLPTQVLFPAVGKVLFANDFRLDLDWFKANKATGENYSQQWATSPQVNGHIEGFKLAANGTISRVDVIDTPNDAPAPDAGAPSIPLNIWSHPKKKILYTNLVTRNGIGVFTYTASGDLTWVGAVSSTGRDVCWLRTNAAGTRLYQISNNTNAAAGDTGGSIEVFDISGANATAPKEIQRISLPTNGTSPFVNDRGQTQAGSTPFIPTFSPGYEFFYVGMQRVNQVPGNTNPLGNNIVGFKVNKDGTLDPKPVVNRDLANYDLFPTDSRAWGLTAVVAK